MGWGKGAGSWTPAHVLEKQGEWGSAIWGLRGKEEGEMSDQDSANSSSQRILRKYCSGSEKRKCWGLDSDKPEGERRDIGPPSMKDRRSP